MADLPIALADLQGIIDTVCGKVKGANHDDAAEAVSVALLEWAEKGDDLDLDLSRSVNGALVTRAVWRLKTALSRREARNLSLDAFLEEDIDKAPVELAVEEVDFDSHMVLREASDNPVTRITMQAAERGAAAEIHPRGRAQHSARYDDEIVEQVRALKGELPYAQIAERLGIPQKTVEKWCRFEQRIMPTTPGWSRDLIVETIKSFEREEGRRPTIADLADPRLPSMDTIRVYCGRFTNALAAAGIHVEAPLRRWPNKKITEAIGAFAEREGRLPGWKDWGGEEADLPSNATLERRFGTTRASAILKMIERAPA